LKDWTAILSECLMEVKNRVTPIYKTPRAAEDVSSGAGGDRTKRIDFEAEEAIIGVLKHNDVSCTLVSEEAGILKLGSKREVTIITDPIDGTINAIMGIPVFGSLIAVASGSNLRSVIAGGVMQLPSGDLYLAERGRGATLNGKTLKARASLPLERAVIGLNISSSRIQASPKRTDNLLSRLRHARHLGADGLEVCFVASGLYDAFIDIRDTLRITNIAASSLILREAGGLIVSPEGAEVDAAIDPKSVLSIVAACDQRICEQILELLR